MELEARRETGRVIAKGPQGVIVNDLQPKAKTKARKAYNPATVNAFFATHEIPAPHYELAFHPDRKWRFDMAWGQEKVALEVQGGIWGGGRHTRGAALLKEWEKLNTAAADGWRILYCQPDDLLTAQTANYIKNALKYA
jgi:hypothetical protein